jgi:hypothetical protein
MNVLLLLQYKSPILAAVLCNSVQRVIRTTRAPSRAGT